MPRIASIVVPGYPHHIVQRGNRRLNVFVSDCLYRASEKSLPEPSRLSSGWKNGFPARCGGRRPDAPLKLKKSNADLLVRRLEGRKPII